MVWGSSAGWLVLYGFLGCGWTDCCGYELLRCLVIRARDVARAVLDGQASVVAAGGGANVTHPG
jgi:hypothetical protein